MAEPTENPIELLLGAFCAIAREEVVAPRAYKAAADGTG